MRTKKSIVVLLALCFILTICIPFSANAEDTEPQRLREIIELRESNVKTYQLDNGQFQCDVYATDIHYLDQHGDFKEINNNIKIAEGKEGYTFTNTSNSWYTYFADNLSSDNAVVLEKDGCSISFSLQGSKQTGSVQSSNALDTTKSMLEKTLAEDTRAVVYKDVFENVDIVYTARNIGLKEDIILRDKTAPNTFVFDLELKGLSLIEKEDLTCFINNEGEVIFSILPMFMVDANEKYSEAVTYKITPNGKNYTITVTADKDFLNASDTVYPVRIDPTYNTTGSSYTSDSFDANGSGRTDDNYYLYNWLRTGKDTTYGKRRTFIRFKLPSGYRYDGITAATLKLKLYSDGSGDNTIIAHNVDEYWRSNEITWDDMPDMGSVDSSGTTVSSNWYNINVIDAIEDCYHQETSNFGFVVFDEEEDDTNTWGTFYSSDHSSSSYRPILSITYTNITGYQYHSGNWSPGFSDDLNIYTDTNAVLYFYSEIDDVWDLWNGIDTDFNIDTKGDGGDPDDHEIVIKGVTTLPAGTLGYTTFYNVNDVQVFPYLGDYWAYAVIELNINSGQLRSLHEDLQKEVILHELGHAAGLAHVNANSNASSVCIMQQSFSYCYPSPPHMIAKPLMISTSS